MFKKIIKVLIVIIILIAAYFLGIKAWSIYSGKAIPNVLEKKAPFETQGDVSSFIAKFPTVNKKWLYKKLGPSISFYKGKITINTFSVSDIKALIKMAYVIPNTAVERQLQKSAVYALEYSIYPFLLSKPQHESYKELVPLLYSPHFLQYCFAISETFISVIPENRPNYEALVSLAIEENMTSFHHLKMRTKLNPKTLETLFYLSSSPGSLSHKLAVQYAGNKQLEEFLAYDGSVYRYLPEPKKANRKLAYQALLQDDESFKEMPLRLQYAIEEIGLIEFNTFKGRFIAYKYSILPLVDYIRESIRTSYRYCLDLTVYYGQSILTKDLEKPLKQVVKAPYSSRSKLILKKYPYVQGKLLGFKQHFEIVSDLKVIKKIEEERKKSLINIWKIADVPNKKIKIYVVYYEPKNNIYTGGIICKKGGDYMYSDYLAIHSYDGSSVWRVGDKGKFHGKNFLVKAVALSKKGILEFVITWKGKKSDNLYRMIEEEGELVKGFISYGNLL